MVIYPTRKNTLGASAPGKYTDKTLETIDSNILIQESTVDHSRITKTRNKTKRPLYVQWCPEKIQNTEAEYIHFDYSNTFNILHSFL